MNSDSTNLRIGNGVVLPLREIEISGIHASGPGGQNVNKVASAVHLRFDVRASSLPDSCKQRLLALSDRRISKDGVVVIKAQRFRTRDKNRDDALERLRALIGAALARRRPRRPTVPGAAARERRLKEKSRRARVKQTRGRVSGSEE